MKVTLIDYPRDLIGTFSKVWAMSKTDGDWENAKPDEAEFFRVLDAEVPVLRFAQFVWIIEDMPVFFREQLVRAKHEDFWIQSMRVADMSRFAGTIAGTDDPPYSRIDGTFLVGNARYHVPDEVKGTANEHRWHSLMSRIGYVYNELLKEYPEEVARRILPLATLHRGAWFTNLQALTERFKKRSCWVAEDLWVDVLRQVRQELVDKVHPVFASICTPPCFRRGSDTYSGCTINEIMTHRYDGRDPLPLCPLWKQHGHVHGLHTPLQEKVDDDRTDKFAGLWGRDPHTGARVPK